MIVIQKIIIIIKRRLSTFKRGSLHSSPMFCWVSKMPSTLTDADDCNNWKHDCCCRSEKSLKTSLIVRILSMSTLTRILTRLPTSRGGGGLSFKYCSGLRWTIWQEASSLWSSQSAFWSHLKIHFLIFHLFLWLIKLPISIFWQFFICQFLMTKYCQ